MKLTNIVIPNCVDFADLGLTRDSKTGHLEFNWDPIKAVCEESGIDVEVFENAPDENVAALISGWYAHHVMEGGERNATMDDILVESALEGALGDGISHKPGRA